MKHSMAYLRTKSAVWVVWTIGSVSSRVCQRVDVAHRYIIDKLNPPFPVACSLSTYHFQRPLATPSSFRITSHSAGGNRHNSIIIPYEGEAQHLKDETGDVRLEKHAWTTPRHAELASALVESSIETSTQLKRKWKILRNYLIWYVLVLWLDVCFLCLIRLRSCFQEDPIFNSQWTHDIAKKESDAPGWELCGKKGESKAKTVSLTTEQRIEHRVDSLLRNIRKMVCTCMWADVLLDMCSKFC